MTTALTTTRTLCSQTLAKGSKSFALAGRLLPQRTRDDAATLYTFCRRVDDAVDLAPPETEQLALDAVRHRLRSVYAGVAQNEPFWATFAELVTRTRLPSAYVDEFLRGMQMDVDGTRYQTLDDLLLYCHRVAGVVGLMMCHVLGVKDDAALSNAAHLGIALQLTNIARDVEEDWQRGRVYVPVELLERAGLKRLDPDRGRALTHEEGLALSRAVGELLDVAEPFYSSGDRGMPALPARARLAVRTARLVYAQIAVLLRKRACNVLGGRVIVPIHQKLLLVARALCSSFCELWTSRHRAESARLPTRSLQFPEDILPPPSNELAA